MWANDICPKKAAVYDANHPPHPVHVESIADVRGSDLSAADLAWASFPCQDLSLAGRRRQRLEVRFDGVAGCLRTPGGGSSRQVVLIVENGGVRSRLMTVRECARLMGAPDWYQVPGTYNEGYRAMGDAVAVPVVRWLTHHLLAPLADRWRGSDATCAA